MVIEGKRVLLTGASSGIGRELARVLAEHGARLALAARREHLLESLAGEIESAGRGRPAVLPTDLSERGAAASLARRASDALGGVDVLVNNAGVGVGGNQWRVGDRDEARACLETNFWSPLALTAELVPHMRERGSGAVVNVTSIAQVMTLWSLGHYSASKAALALATETLRLELTGSGVHVLEVVAGPTDTAVQGESKLIGGAAEMLKNAPMGKPDELARRIARALERERARLVYPRALRAVYELPSLYRVYAPLMARRLERVRDPEDERVALSGSAGHPDARAARAEWEQPA